MLLLINLFSPFILTHTCFTLISHLHTFASLLLNSNSVASLVCCLREVLLFLAINVQMQVGKKVEQGARSPSAPAGLFFQHAGHRYVTTYFNCFLEQLLVIFTETSWFSENNQDSVACSPSNFLFLVIS